MQNNTVIIDYSVKKYQVDGILTRNGDFAITYFCKADSQAHKKHAKNRAQVLDFSTTGTDLFQTSIVTIRAYREHKVHLQLFKN